MPDRTYRRYLIAALTVLAVAAAVTAGLYYLRADQVPAYPVGELPPEDTVGGQGTVIDLPDDSSALWQLRAYVGEMAAGRELRHASWGFVAQSLPSDTPLVSWNDRLSLVPASVMKLITTGVALDVLGADYRFRTFLQYDGAVDTSARTLNGDLYIMGGGDPTLGSDVFGTTRRDTVLARWVRAVRNAGIDTVNGAVIGDAQAFELDMVPPGWAWEDMQSGYCAGASGLSFGENVYHIRVETGRDTFLLEPAMDIPDFQIESTLRVGDDLQSAVWISSSPYMNKCFIQGALSTDSARFGIKCQVPDPPYLSAWLLHRALKEGGVTVRGEATTLRRQGRFGANRGSGRTTIHTTVSPPLPDIIRHTNAVSQNFYAESILKAMALHRRGFGSTAGGADVVRSWFTARGVDLRGFYQYDGSGLSRFNAVSAGQLVRMLSVFAADSALFARLRDVLPVAGRTGTLKGICLGTPAEGKVMAKSGYMTRVRSYAGYVPDAGGRMIAFAMMANNFDCSPLEMRKHFERLMALMAASE